MKSLLFVVVALLLLLTGMRQRHPAGTTTGPGRPRRPAGAVPTGHPLIVVRKSAQAPARPKTVRALPSTKKN